MLNATRSELRARARASLKGNWGKSIGAMLLAAIPSFVLGILGTFSRPLEFAGNVMSFILAGMIGLGTVIFFLGLARRQNPPVTDVYRGFDNAGKAFPAYVLMTVITALWTLLFIVPGIIAALRYSLVFYVLADNPKMRPLDALRRSKQLMVGHKWRLFVLQLSFIGWILLCIPTLGIGMLWVAPYMAVTTAHFYEELNNQDAQPSAPSEF